MQKKFILGCLAVIFFLLFSGCVSEYRSNANDETTPSIDCESYNPNDDTRSIIWNVTNVEDGTVKWSECSWKLISSTDSKNDEDATVDYSDKDNDGNISKNDYFTVLASEEGTYSFKIIYKSTDGYAFVSPVTSYPGKETLALSLKQEGSIQDGSHWVNFSVASASADAKWQDLEVRITGDGIDEALSGPTQTSSPSAGACGYSGDSDPIKAGTKLYIQASSPFTSGDHLVVIHKASNSQILEKTIT